MFSNLPFSNVSSLYNTPPKECDEILVKRPDGEPHSLRKKQELVGFFVCQQNGQSEYLFVKKNFCNTYGTPAHLRYFAGSETGGGGVVEFKCN